jgi:uncharacterized LabA/DUF88 family protein
MLSRYAILLDGAFVTKKLQVKLKNFPAAADIQAECQRIAARPELAGRDLLRIYFYDAEPLTDTLKNPLDGSTINLSATPVFRQHTSLLDTLELTPHFAVRRGEAVNQGWKLGSSALRSMLKTPRPLTATDIVPDLKQKGVDLRIGLDIARLALCKMVDIIVVVTGDSDLVPAFKFARREGVRVFLDYMGHGVKRDLKAHADLVL